MLVSRENTPAKTPGGSFFTAPASQSTNTNNSSNQNNSVSFFSPATKPASTSTPQFSFNSSAQFSGFEPRSGRKGGVDDPASFSLTPGLRQRKPEGSTTITTPTVRQSALPSQSLDDIGAVAQSISVSNQQRSTTLQMLAAKTSGQQGGSSISTPSKGGVDLGSARGLGVSSPCCAVASEFKDKEQWVTVFGYPSGSAAHVLQYFQGCGEINQHKAQAGNWMHIRYASPVQASRALGKNGQYVRLGSNVVMIGVKPCSELDLLSNNTSTQQSNLTQRKPTGSVRHQGGDNYKLNRPEELRHAPKKAVSVCKRFWRWVLDW